MSSGTEHVWAYLNFYLRGNRITRFVDRNVQNLWDNRNILRDMTQNDLHSYLLISARADILTWYQRAVIERVGPLNVYNLVHFDAVHLNLDADSGLKRAFEVHRDDNLAKEEFDFGRLT